MDPIFKKLNYKNQKEIIVLNAPNSFNSSLNAMKEFAGVKTKISTSMDFVIGFATTLEDLNDIIHAVAPCLVGDAIFWICYPKMNSKKYRCEFNRDTGWTEIGKYDMEPVRAVAIDEDWSALRFRKVEFIKNFTRNSKMIISESGKEKAKKLNFD